MNNDHKNFKEMIRNGFSQLIDKPTRIARNTMTYIDRIYTNKINIRKSGTLDINVSDHKPIFTIRSINFNLRKNKDKHIVLRYRKWRNIDIQLLVNEVQNLNSEFEFEEQDFNFLCEKYFGHIYDLQENFVPIIEKRVKTAEKVKLINKEISKLLNEKDCCKKFFNKSKIWSTE
jgi:hypothetical protein